MLIAVTCQHKNIFQYLYIMQQIFVCSFKGLCGMASMCLGRVFSAFVASIAEFLGTVQNRWYPCNLC